MQWRPKKYTCSTFSLPWLGSSQCSIPPPISNATTPKTECSYLILEVVEFCWPPLSHNPPKTSICAHPWRSLATSTTATLQPLKLGIHAHFQRLWVSTGHQHNPQEWSHSLLPLPPPEIKHSCLLSGLWASSGIHHSSTFLPPTCSRWIPVKSRWNPGGAIQIIPPGINYLSFILYFPK